MTRHLSLLILLFATVATADDTFVTLGAGGIVPVKSASVRMLTEDLRLSIGQVSVDFIFENTSTKSIDSLLAFELPDIDGGTLYNVPLELPHRGAANFLEARITADESPVRFATDIRAFHDGKDITSYLQSEDVPADVQAVQDVRRCQLPQLTRKKLVQAELLEIDPDGSCWGTWTTRVRLLWHQRFPAHGKVSLHQSYRPVVGGGYGSFDQSFGIGEPFTSYCGGERSSELARFRSQGKSKGDGSEDYYYRELEYILTTAKNWNGPIGTFHLTIDLPTAQDVLLTCEPGLKKVSPTRFEVSSKNYRPTHELKIAILQPPSEVKR